MTRFQKGDEVRAFGCDWVVTEVTEVKPHGSRMVGLRSGTNVAWARESQVHWRTRVGNRVAIVCRMPSGRVLNDIAVREPDGTLIHENTNERVVMRHEHPMGWEIAD